MSQHDNASDPATGPGNAKRPSASRAVRVACYSLLVMFSLVSIWWPFYNRIEPQFAGIPFFLWFQFVWISLSAAATAFAYKMRA